MGKLKYGIGVAQMIRFSGVKAGEACTIVLRGSSKQLLDEAERSIHDALCVLSQTTGVSYWSRWKDWLIEQ